MDNKELLWRQYELDIELYKHYLKLTIEFNVFFYAITGGIFSFYLAHADQPLLKYSLLLPIAMSLFFSCFFIYGGELMKISRRSVFNIRDALGFEQAPDVGILTIILRIFAALKLVVAIPLCVFFFKA